MQPDASVAPTVIMTRFAVVLAVALVVTLTGMGTVRCASGQRSPAYPAVYQSENLPSYRAPRSSPPGASRPRCATGSVSGSRHP